MSEPNPFDDAPRKVRPSLQSSCREAHRALREALRMAKAAPDGRACGEFANAARILVEVVVVLESARRQPLPGRE